MFSFLDAVIRTGKSKDFDRLAELVNKGGPNRDQEGFVITGPGLKCSSEHVANEEKTAANRVKLVRIVARNRLAGNREVVIFA